MNVGRIDAKMQKSDSSNSSLNSKYQDEYDWECDSPKNFGLTLYITNKANDTFNINYTVAYKNYLAGDVGLILGGISKSALFSKLPTETVITHPENQELMNVSITFFRKDSSLLWQLVD